MKRIFASADSLTKKQACFLRQFSEAYKEPISKMYYPHARYAAYVDIGSLDEFIDKNFYCLKTTYGEYVFFSKVSK